MIKVKYCFFQNQFTKFGGTLRDGEKVLSIKPGKKVTVITNKGRYQANSIVLTPGPWASQLLEPLEIKLPLQVRSLCLNEQACLIYHL